MKDRVPTTDLIDRAPLSGLAAEGHFDLFLMAIRRQTAAPARCRPQPLLVPAARHPAESSPRETALGRKQRGRGSRPRGWAAPLLTASSPASVSTSVTTASGGALGALCDAARDTFLAPLLYALLPELAAAETEEVSGETGSFTEDWSRLRTELAPLYYANAARKAALLQLLEQTAAAFEQAGIEFLLLKGAALEVTLELPPALRVMADLDLLVPETALAAAEATLVACGLAPSRDRENADLLRRRGYHVAPYLAPHGGAVELHRGVLPRSAPFRLPASALWRSSRSVSWRGRIWQVPSPEHLFLHTVIHSGYWHTHGTALRRLWDLSLITEWGGLDFGLLKEEATRCGANRLSERGVGEVEALHTEDTLAWQELARRLRATDELWTPHTAWDRLRARSRSLDNTAQRLALLRYAALPAWEETANATGCSTPIEHWGRFLSPRRVWGAVRGIARKRG